jgi:hypothetical protein
MQMQKMQALSIPVTGRKMGRKRREEKREKEGELRAFGSPETSSKTAEAAGIRTRTKGILVVAFFKEDYPRMNPKKRNFNSKTKPSKYSNLFVHILFLSTISFFFE